MNNRVSAASYLARSEQLLEKNEREALIYATLELRCGIEARMQEHLAVAPGVSKGRAGEWEIKKLVRTVDEAFGLGDKMLLLFLSLQDGRACQFMYAPVNSQLQEIAKRCGDYLHAQRPERVANSAFWDELRAMVQEGCGILKLACNSEVLCPNLDSGLHFSLPPGDSRETILKDFIAGMPGKSSTVEFTPTGRMTYYPE